MSDTTIGGPAGAAHAHRHVQKKPEGRPDLDGGTHFAAIIIFIVLLLLGLGFTVRGLLGDMNAAGTPPLAIGAFVLLGLALLIALGFEFVNGFHDTANAVATVIYTHSMPAQVAVVWSGAFNFLGVLCV
jgi:PiT family inorganic phosphate transporter